MMSSAGKLLLNVFHRFNVIMMLLGWGTALGATWMADFEGDVKLSDLTGKSFTGTIEGEGVSLERLDNGSQALRQLNEGKPSFHGGALNWPLWDDAFLTSGYITTWYQPEGLGTYNCIFGIGNPIWHTKGVFSLFYDNPSQRLYFRMRSGKGNGGDAMLKVSLKPNHWVKLACTWKYDVTKQRMIFAVGVSQDGSQWTTDSVETTWEEESLGCEGMFGKKPKLWFGSGRNGYNPACGLLDHLQIGRKPVSFSELPKDSRQPMTVLGHVETASSKERPEDNEGNVWTSQVIPLPKLQGVPCIDGRLEPNPERFSLVPVMLQPGTHRAVSSRTKASIASYQAGLYVFVDCECPRDGILTLKEMPHDGEIYANECVEMHLLDQEGNHYQVVVDALGQTYDAKNKNLSWEGKSQVAILRDHEHWSAEILIPFTSLGGKEATDYRLNIARHHTGYLPAQLSQLVFSPTMSFLHFASYSRLLPSEGHLGFQVQEGISGGPAGQTLMNLSVQLPGATVPPLTRLLIRDSLHGKVLKEFTTTSLHPSFDVEIVTGRDAFLAQIQVVTCDKTVANMLYPVKLLPKISASRAKMPGKQQYPFLNNRLGMDKRVPKPFKPIVFKESTAVFNNGSLQLEGAWIRQLNSGERPLLAGPFKLMVNDSPVRSGALEAFRNEGDVLSFCSSLQAGKAVGTLKVETEFDSMTYMNFALPATDADVFRLEIPIKSSWVRFLEVSDSRLRNNNGHVIKPVAGKKLRFRKMPRFLVGGRGCALAFCWEYLNRWKTLDPTQAIEYYRDGRGTDHLTLQFNSDPTKAKQTVLFDLNFLIMPTKRMRSFSVDRDAAWVDVYYPQRLLTAIPGVPGTLTVLDRMHELGVKTVVFFDHWMKYQTGHTPALDHVTFKKIIDAVHHAGMNVVLYRSRELSDASPLWQDFSELCLTIPSSYGFKRRYPLSQTSYGYCPHSPLGDYFIWSADYLMRTYDIDGFYLDGAAADVYCSNARHGCGQGTGEPVYGVRANRLLMKRLWKLFAKHGKEPLIDAHGFSPFATSFLTHGFEGEQFYKLRRFDKAPHDVLPSDVMEPLFGPNGYRGFHTNMLFYDGCPFTAEEASALAWVNGVAPRPHSVERLPGSYALESVAPIWRALREFGADRATWHLWSDNMDYTIRLEPSMPGGNHLVKLTVLENSNESLYLVANYGIYTTLALITNPIRGPIVSARDMLAQKPLDFSDKVLNVWVPPYKLQVFRVRFKDQK